MSLRALLLIVIAAIAVPAWAENQCIREGSQEIILFDHAQTYCPMESAPVDPQLQWKFLADMYQKESKGVEADRYREISRKHKEAAIQEINGPSDDADLS